MVKVYAVSLALGVLGILVVVFGGAWAEARDRPGSDPASRLGRGGQAVIGGLTGFGMAGMSAEFSPLGFDWPVSMLLALVGAGAGVVWVRFSLGRGT